jgi:cellulose synthase/poly-beta-1,6-N-acetylglucosamine synthase-like glycosyltransferase
MVACKDEQAVVDGLVDSLLELDYPRDRLELIVVDDGSSDGTGALLDARAGTEPLLLVLHRPRGGSGGKSAALNVALAAASGEVVVIFDADHQPRPDVIHRLVRHFEDPQVAAVQGRCEIRNPDDSLLTRLVALDYLAGYLVNEYGRQSLFCLPACGGANCAIRVTSLREIGGFNPETVTEDTDVTMRLILTGQRVRYDVTAVDTEEGVVSLQRYWRQRYRWARGHQKVCRDYRGAVIRSPHLGVAEKIESIMFLLVFHLPVLSAAGIGLLLLSTAGIYEPAAAIDTFVIWTLLFLGPLLELGGALLVARVPRRHAFTLALFLPMFFVSIALCTRAWVDGLAGRRYAWVKTKRAADLESAPGRPLATTA